MDRSELINGVWDEDINKYPNQIYEFTAECGYKCEIRRNFSWVYCGYVQLPSSHPDYNKHYDDIPIDVHGKLTYGRDGKFGFDCNHLKDISPMDESYKVNHPDLFSKFGEYTNNNEKHYWTFEEVKYEVERMAQEFRNRQ